MSGGAQRSKTAAVDRHIRSGSDDGPNDFALLYR